MEITTDEGRLAGQDSGRVAHTGICLSLFVPVYGQRSPAGDHSRKPIAVAFLSIDLYYTFTDVISDIYLADGAVEFIFLMLWLIYAFRRRHDRWRP